MANSRVVVPCTGTSVVASKLTGDKHLIVTGKFSSTLTIMASHDNTLFVPVVSIDPENANTWHQVLEGTYESLAAMGSAPNESPSIEVLSLGEAGENYFGVVGAFLEGDTDAKTIDLVQLFPAELSEDLSLICQGAFTGTILVEQSLGGVTWTTVGSFDPSTCRLLLCEADNCSRLRFTPTGTISNVVTISLGGRTVAEETAEDPVCFYAATARLFKDDGSKPFVGEKVLCEWLVDFDKLANNLEVYFSSVVRSVPKGSQSRFGLHVGSQISGSFEGSQLVAELTTTCCCEATARRLGIQFLNPKGQCYVQVVGSIESRSHVSFIRDVIVGIG